MRSWKNAASSGSRAELEHATRDGLRLGVAPAHEVPVPEHGREDDRRGPVGAVGRPRERRPEVGELELEASKLFALERLQLLRPERRKAACVPLQVTITKVAELVGRLELLGGELADRLEHEVPRFVACARRLPNETLGDERQDLREISVAHLFDRRQRGAADEHREATKHALLGLVEQLVAPRDRSSQGALALVDVAGTRQDVEAGSETLEQRCRRQRRRSCGCQLDGEREVVEPRAKLGHRRPGLDGVGARAGGASASVKELDGVGRDERLHREHVLAGDRERLTARREDQGVRAAAAHGCSDLCRCVDEVLAVVEEEKQTLSLHRTSDRVGQRPARLLVDVEDTGYGGGHEPTVPERGQGHPPDPVRKRVGELGGQLQREPRLPGPARPRQGQDTDSGLRGSLHEPGELLLAAEERRGRNREVRAEERLQRRKLVLAELMEHDRRGKILETVRSELAKRELARLEEADRCRRDHDLATVPARPDSRRTVDVHPQVVPIHDEGLAGVDADAYMGGTGCEAFLDRTGTRHRRSRRFERTEERVSLHVDLDASVFCERTADDVPVPAEVGRVPLGTELLEEPGRALHVREEERHRAGWQHLRHGRSVRPATSARRGAMRR